MKIIDSFKGDFEFLSNFSPHKFRDTEGIKWRTSEHFFQGMKTIRGVERGKIWSASTPGKAKRLGRLVTLRENWEGLKRAFMGMGVRLKFEQNEDIRRLLLSLEDYMLVEGNWWHDNFWGDCRCHRCKNIKGKNNLGITLMIVRDNLLEVIYERNGRNF